MKIPVSLHFLLCTQYLNILTVFCFIVVSFSVASIRDAYGYFIWVLAGFAVLFLLLDQLVMCYLREMKSRSQEYKGLAVSTPRSENTHSGMKTDKIDQELAKTFTCRYGIVFLLKTILSVIYMCQFVYSYELAERKMMDDTGHMDADAKQASSHVIFVTMLASAAFLTSLRLAEGILFFVVRAWSASRSNFKTRTSHKSTSGRGLMCSGSPSMSLAKADRALKNASSDETTSSCHSSSAHYQAIRGI